MLEGSDNGVWNKVSHWVDYIREKVNQLGEDVCFGNEGNYARKEDAIDDGSNKRKRVESIRRGEN